MRIVVAVVIALGVSRPALAFDTWWHAEATRKACEASGFSADARLAMQIENYLTDVFPGVNIANSQYHEIAAQLGLPSDESYEWMHFDAVFTTKDVIANWKKLQSNTLAALQHYAAVGGITEQERQIALLSILGASLHTVQDFYSHSNWVNTYVKAGKSVPLWFDVPEAEIMKMDIHTGAYPDGSSKGHENHGDLNKDSSLKKLNVPAVTAGTRASIQWLEGLQAMDPTLPWDQLKAYKVDNDQMKDFLKRLDATFLTSSSIVAKHFDGLQPAKFVFAPGDVGKERLQAASILALTVKEYLVYMHAKGNKYALPSPYWVGHMSFHVTHEIADGLLLDGKTYHPPK